MKKFVKPIIIIAACVLLEILLSNFTAISLKLSGCETVELNIEDAVLIEGKDEDVLEIEDGHILVDRGKMRFENINTEMKNICIEVESGVYSYLNLELSFTDDNFAYENGFDNNRYTFQMYFEKVYKNYITHSSFGKVKTLELNFPDKAYIPFEITSIKINSPPPFGFSVVRFTLMIFVCFSVCLGVWKWKTGNNDYSMIMLNAALVCIFVAVVTMYSARLAQEPLLDKYPLEDVYTVDQYEQLFDAFHSGRLDIEVDADKDEFEALNNPYDISERDDAEVDGDYWDRAYYDGKFYSYFGVAPVFTVYCPIYLFTHQLPSAKLASMIVTIYAVFFLTMLYILVLKKFCTDVPLLAAVMGHLALIFGSSVLALNTEQLFYYIAVISGIGCTAAFLYFILKAYFEESFKLRIAFLVLSGVSAVMIVASRPTMVIYCVSAIVPAVFILGSKEETVKRKIIYACSIGVPLVIGAAGIMTYNYLRFDSPFEFGFNYQLTVSIAQANNIALGYIPATLYHYFFQLPKIKSQYPYIELNSNMLSSYPRYTYLSANIGVFSYPITWGLALVPVTDKKKDRFKSFFLLSLLLAALLLSFVDMCKAGSHYRYVSDILVPLILVATVVMLDVLHMLRNAPKRVYCTVYIFTLLAMAATVVVGYLLIFANENAYFMGDYAFITQILRMV